MVEAGHVTRCSPLIGQEHTDRDTEDEGGDTDLDTADHGAGRSRRESGVSCVSDAASAGGEAGAGPREGRQGRKRSSK